MNKNLIFHITFNGLKDICLLLWFLVAFFNFFIAWDAINAILILIGSSYSWRQFIASFIKYFFLRKKSNFIRQRTRMLACINTIKKVIHILNNNKKKSKKKIVIIPLHKKKSFMFLNIIYGWVTVYRSVHREQKKTPFRLWII